MLDMFVFENPLRVIKNSQCISPGLWLTPLDDSITASPVHFPPPVVTRGCDPTP